VARKQRALLGRQKMGTPSQPYRLGNQTNVYMDGTCSMKDSTVLPETQRNKSERLKHVQEVNIEMDHRQIGCGDV
jgi:hypothetical protein